MKKLRGNKEDEAWQTSELGDAIIVMEYMAGCPYYTKHTSFSARKSLSLV